MPERPNIRRVLRVAAELLLIVAGVLVALWVDNLNQDRRDRVQESTYLEGILRDLVSDSADLHERRVVAERGMRVADRLVALRREATKTVEADSLATWLFQAAFVDNFQTLDHTYREILGAGGLTLISDERLRRAISSYYRSLESADFFTQFYVPEERDYWDLLAERLHPQDFEAVSRVYERAGQLDPGRVLGQLRRDDAMVNAILMNRHWSSLRLEITNRRIQGLEELMSMLRDEL